MTRRVQFHRGRRCPRVDARRVQVPSELDADVDDHDAIRRRVRPVGATVQRHAHMIVRSARAKRDDEREGLRMGIDVAKTQMQNQSERKVVQ